MSENNNKKINDMKWFTKFYNWAKPEGWLHMTICAFLFLVFAPVFFIFVPNKIVGQCLAVTLVEALCLGYSLYKSIQEGTATWHDLICDNIGIATGLVLFGWITYLCV